MEPGRTSVIGTGEIAGIAIKGGYGLRCLFALRPGRERKVTRVHDDMISHEDRAKAFVMDILKQAESLNKDLTEGQLMDELHKGYTIVADEFYQARLAVRKGVRKWS